MRSCQYEQPEDALAVDAAVLVFESDLAIEFAGHSYDLRCRAHMQAPSASYLDVEFEQPASPGFRPY
jgi:hypothetical protein